MRNAYNMIDQVRIHSLSHCQFDMIFTIWIYLVFTWIENASNISRYWTTPGHMVIHNFKVAEITRMVVNEFGATIVNKYESMQFLMDINLDAWDKK